MLAGSACDAGGAGCAGRTRDSGWPTRAARTHSGLVATRSDHDAGERGRVEIRAEEKGQSDFRCNISRLG